jgi:glutamine amidotransferase
MIAVIDYDAGNILSAVKAFQYLGFPVSVTRDEQKIRQADGIVLPGVGAFADAMVKITSYGLDKIIKEEVSNGKPFLGICLGMQVLFDEGDEGGKNIKGLSLIPGKVKKIKTPYKIPHMGWNSLKLCKASPLFYGIKDDTYVYFVHSYCAHVEDMDTLDAVTEYGELITAAVSKGNIFGTQFHPEKSSEAGLNILRNFGRLTIR